VGGCEQPAPMYTRCSTLPRSAGRTAAVSSSPGVEREREAGEHDRKGDAAGKNRNRNMLFRQAAGRPQLVYCTDRR
jgi:hypothetical protein